MINIKSYYKMQRGNHGQGFLNFKKNYFFFICTSDTAVIKLNPNRLDISEIKMLK